MSVANVQPLCTRTRLVGRTASPAAGRGFARPSVEGNRRVLARRRVCCHVPARLHPTPAWKRRSTPAHQALEAQGRGPAGAEEVEVWYAMLVPAGTPQAVVAGLNTEVQEILSTPEVREALAAQGLSPVGGPPQRLAGLLRTELARWPRVVAKAGIKAD